MKHISNEHKWHENSWLVGPVRVALRHAITLNEEGTNEKGPFS